MGTSWGYARWVLLGVHRQGKFWFWGKQVLKG
jgi:hypothetical protein